MTRRPTVSAALALFLAALGAGAQAGVRDGARSRTVSLASVKLDVTALPETPQGLEAVDQPYFLVKYPGPVTARQREALDRETERVYTYLPYDTFLVKSARDLAEPGLRTALGASWAGPYHPAYKIAPAVASVATPGRGPGGAPRILMLLVYPDADLDAVQASVKRLGGNGIVGAARSPFFSRIRLLATDAEVVALREGLARVPEMFWIDLEKRKALLNDTTIWVGQSGVNGGQTTPVFNHGIHGEGQVVGIIDTGIDADMCYFRDPALGTLPPQNVCNGGTVVNTSQRKVLAADFLWTQDCAGGINNFEWDDHGHGTHVAGTVAGDNFANPIGHDPGDGMAPGAKLVIQDGGFQTDNCADLPGIGCPLVDMNPLFQQAYDQGARLHTNSYGDNENAPPPFQSNYTTASQDVDEFMWNHKDFQIFFAAGNSGPVTSSVGSPSTAKNVISVGATHHGSSAEGMAGFSSCGPTDDNRIKPDLTIPGENVVSAGDDGNVTTNNCGEAILSGTSMASPAAAGFGALARQYYTDGFYPSGAATPGDAFTPTSALVKATLLNSAQNMTGVSPPIPSNCQGWGRILLDNALFFPGDARRLWVSDDTTGFPMGSSGETRSYDFTVNSSSVPFKVSLVWTDFPSTPAANPHLNDDLDLEVVGPGGTFLGNVFAGGQSTTGGSPDRRNTVEQVLRLAPTPGTYTVTVRSFTVPNGPQPFALVVTGDVTPPVPVALLSFDVE